MILSDVSIRKAIAEGRIVIEPLDERAIQPSSVDVHVDRYFRVFRNDTTPYIDPREPQEDLTELVEVKDEGTFILHPGEFVLASTVERVTLPDDLVGRIEGKSSLGRLGLLIHSSLPGSEQVVVRVAGVVQTMAIERVVRKELAAEVVSFDPETFAVRYAPITGWYEGPPDRIHEIRLSSGRSVRVTAGHNLFTLDGDGRLHKIRTGALRPGTRVAVPGQIPRPAEKGEPVLEVSRLLPEGEYQDFVVCGPTVAEAAATPEAAAALRSAGIRHVESERERGSLPMVVARQLGGLVERLNRGDSIRSRRGRDGLPALLGVDAEVAWLLGLYVAEGCRSPDQVAVSHTRPFVLDRAQRVFARMGLPVSRAEGASLTCSSVVLSSVLGALGVGGHASDKRIPRGVLGWPDTAIESFLEGMIDGHGSREYARDSYWTSSPGLASDLMLLAARLGRRASASFRDGGGHGLFQVSMPRGEHELLTSVPLPDRLLVRVREAAGLTQRAAAQAVGFGNHTDLCKIERRTQRDAVRLRTLRRLRDTYASTGAAAPELDRLLDGGLAWDTVVEVRDTGETETIFDIEVRPPGHHVENFLAGFGGVFVSNTAGFIDAGWNGYLTLELSNVANLPIAIYPGMKIGQISFMPMTTPAEHPYGSGEAGSKYQGQRGPTPSRYYLNFEPRR